MSDAFEDVVDVGPPHPARLELVSARVLNGHARIREIDVHEGKTTRVPNTGHVLPMENGNVIVPLVVLWAEPAGDSDLGPTDCLTPFEINSLPLRRYFMCITLRRILYGDVRVALADLVSPRLLQHTVVTRVDHVVEPGSQ